MHTVGCNQSCNASTPTQMDIALGIADEVILMDYNAECHQAFGIPGTSCNPFEFLAFAWPWLTAAGALKARTGREVLVSLGVLACAGDEVGHCTYSDGAAHTELELEGFLGLASRWLGEPMAGRFDACANRFGAKWCPFKNWAIFKHDNCEPVNLGRTMACL
jgi:hypothetical protein